MSWLSIGSFFSLFLCQIFLEMTTSEVKNALILQILQINDQALLEHLVEYFQHLSVNKDWWEELTAAQKELIQRGSEQVARGEVVPDSVVRAKAWQILGKI